jgi:hypothetical protein
MKEQTGGTHIRWPGNRVPATVLLDDPTPCRNPAWYEYPDAGHVAVVPNSFTERFADLIDRTGVAGKFSVVPCPGAQGRIDEGMPGVEEEELASFVRLVRERIAPRWDVSPELLTHNKALDLATMRPLPEREDAWAAHQDEATLTAYIARALQILRNVGLEPNGVTSPWALGSEVEEAYANAIATALRAVCGVRLGWYFLHLDSRAPAVLPRIMRLDPEAGTALVSIISGSREASSGHYDFAWRTQFGEPAESDVLLTADGTSGRLVELFAHDSPLAFHTHWQSLFSNGRGAGLDALGQLCERINRTWGDRVRWTSARELATYCTACEATQVEVGDSGRRMAFRAPFSCFEFTIAVPAPIGTTTLYLDNTPLEQLPDGDAPLYEGAWRRDGADALICMPLRDGTELTWR